MSQPIEGAIAAISSVVSGISGIVDAPNYPPEQANYTPIAITFLLSGEVGGPAQMRQDIFNIAIDLLIPYTMKLDDAIQLLTPFTDTIPLALWAQVSTTTGGGAGGLFNNTINTFQKVSITWIPQTDYAGVLMRGYRFTMIGVKILVAS